jgi:hypothetical protein
MPDKPSIVIEFDADGSATFDAKIRGASPLQVYLACHFMALQAERQVLSQQMNASAPPPIVRPNLRPIPN